MKLLVAALLLVIIRVEEIEGRLIKETGLCATSVLKIPFKLRLEDPDDIETQPLECNESTQFCHYINEARKEIENIENLINIISATNDLQKYPDDPFIQEIEIKEKLLKVEDKTTENFIPFIYNDLQIFFKKMATAYQHSQIRQACIFKKPAFLPINQIELFSLLTPNISTTDKHLLSFYDLVRMESMECFRLGEYLIVEVNVPLVKKNDGISPQLFTLSRNDPLKSCEFFDSESIETLGIYQSQGLTELRAMESLFKGVYIKGEKLECNVNITNPVNIYCSKCNVKNNDINGKDSGIFNETIGIFFLIITFALILVCLCSSKVSFGQKGML